MSVTESHTKDSPTNGSQAKECACTTILTQQSPVDIHYKKTFYVPELKDSLKFEDYTGKVRFAVKVDKEHPYLEVLDGSARIEFLKVPATLRSIHIHQCGEHHIDGKRAPIEIHIIHEIENSAREKYCDMKEEKGKQIVEIFDSQKIVVGLFCEEKNADCKNPKSFVSVLQSVLDSKSAGETKEVCFNIADLLPDDETRKFFHYQGSLTSPQFDEHISWLVMKEPIIVDGANLDKLQNHAAQHPRELKPLNRRFVLRNFE